ncbi:MAG: response regulator, partial [Pseudoflavonifractor sp.]|nr:response regulator [Pseudoflavonifractor sp.]
MPVKAVLIDDERPALRGLEYMLKKYQEIAVVGMYNDPITAIHEIERIKPQVVFLDIHMPQLQGLDAAAMILDASPDSEIVFVTAFDQYAIEAFELSALDYILKPIDQERLNKTIERVIRKCQAVLRNDEKRLQIKCLGRLEVVFASREPIKWRSGKTEELFAFLLHNRGKTVSRDEIIEAVWPDAELERAAHQLHSAVYYIRKTLEQYGVKREQIRISGGYRLELGDTELDVARFRQLCEKIKEGRGISDTDLLPYARRYFEGSGWLWSEAERERLSRDFVQAALTLSGALIESCDFMAAEKLLTNAFAKNPYDEDITALLFELYNRTGEKSNAAKHYREYGRILKSELGIEPGERINSI